MPILNEVDLNIFTAYRFRAWNGTIGETEIKSAYGGFLNKVNKHPIVNSATDCVGPSGQL